MLKWLKLFCAQASHELIRDETSIYYRVVQVRTGKMKQWEIAFGHIVQHPRPPSPCRSRGRPSCSCIPACLAATPPDTREPRRAPASLGVVSPPQCLSRQISTDTLLKMVTDEGWGRCGSGRSREQGQTRATLQDRRN